MKNKIIILCLLLSHPVLSQTSQVDIDGNSKLEIIEGSKICADKITVQNGSTLWAYDYGQILEGDCTVILTPTGSGTITLPVEIVDSVTLPTEFIIETAFPNPFNPTTNIKYGLPERGDVKIVLFNIQGQIINTIFDHSQEAGWYTIAWNGLLNNGKIAPAGIYFMKIFLQSDIRAEFKSIKISLIK